MKNKFKKIVFLFILAAVLMPQATKAQTAVLELGTENSVIRTNEEFQVVLQLLPSDFPMNTVSAEIVFPSDLLFLKEIKDGNSIITAWVEKPSAAIEEGSVVFSGIIANGFSGLIDPFGKTMEPGRIFSLVFQAKRPGQGKLELNNAVVLLNDGKGTSAQTVVKNFKFSVSDTAAEFPLRQVVDNDPPEPFQIYLSRQKEMFGDKWFVVFAAADKNSGVDHYEIAEQRQVAANSNDLDWHSAESPYALKDQRLANFIYVKAVDKSGNQRIAQLLPKNSLASYENFRIWIIIGAILFLAVLIAGWKLKKRFLKKQNVSR